MSNGLPKEITVTKTGRYQVSIRAAIGSSDRVTMSFDSRGDALVVYAAGMRAREKGEDVRSAMQAAVSLANARVVRTMDELVATYAAERWETVENSDHTQHCSRGKGQRVLKPSSYESDMRGINARILPWFGSTRIEEIDSKAVSDWLRWMAVDGVSTVTAKALLEDLRFIVGDWAKRHEQHEDYPWRRCAPIVPANPKRRRNDPSKWDGLPGSKPPVTPLAKVKRLAMQLPAASRITIYIEALTGHRLGESQGLRLGNLAYRADGRLWARITMQRDEQNDAVPWVKSLTSNRDIPFPAILAEYIEQYALRYHGYDLRNPDPTMADRFLIVAACGRDLDGSFLPACRSTARAAMRRERDRNGLGFDDLGYSLNNQQLRRVFATYADVGQAISEAIVLETLPELPTDASKRQQTQWIAERDRRLAAVRVSYEPRHVSAYCGHNHDDKYDRTAAAKVTVGHYLLDHDETATPLRSIADTIDFIARHEMVSLIDEPDPEDVLEVLQLDDPDWILPEEAAARVGMNVSNIYLNIKRGHLDTKTVWLADGGYTTHSADDRNPALPRTVISVESVERFIAARNRPTVAEAAARLGMSGPTVRSNFLDTGLLPYSGNGTHLRVDPAALDRIHTSLLDAVAQIVEQRGPLTPERLRARFNKTGHELLKNRAAKRDWIEHWASQLIAQGRVKRRLDGRLVAVPVAAAAVRHEPPDDTDSLSDAA